MGPKLPKSFPHILSITRLTGVWDSVRLDQAKRELAESQKAWHIELRYCWLCADLGTWILKFHKFQLNFIHLGMIHNHIGHEFSPFFLVQTLISMFFCCLRCSPSKSNKLHSLMSNSESDSGNSSGNRNCAPKRRTRGTWWYVMNMCKNICKIGHG